MDTEFGDHKNSFKKPGLLFLNHGFPWLLLAFFRQEICSLLLREYSYMYGTMVGTQLIDILATSIICLISAKLTSYKA